MRIHCQMQEEQKQQANRAQFEVTVTSCRFGELVLFNARFRRSSKPTTLGLREPRSAERLKAINITELICATSPFQSQALEHAATGANLCAGTLVSMSNNVIPGAQPQPRLHVKRSALATNCKRFFYRYVWLHCRSINREHLSTVNQITHLVSIIRTVSIRILCSNMHTSQKHTQG
jgi:hypothetical protein